MPVLCRVCGKILEIGWSDMGHTTCREHENITEYLSIELGEYELPDKEPIQPVGLVISKGTPFFRIYVKEITTDKDGKIIKERYGYGIGTASYRNGKFIENGSPYSYGNKRWFIFTNQTTKESGKVTIKANKRGFPDTQLEINIV